jgi:hypothetical protein
MTFSTYSRLQHKRPFAAMAVAFTLALSLAPSAASAQAPVAPPPPPSETPRPAAPEPTLDELLGLPPAQPRKDGQAAPIDPARAQLDDQLTATDRANDFRQAVNLMRQTASRLEAAQDVGIDTQRLQQQTLDRLDKMIEQAERNRQEQKSRSSSQSRQQQQQQESAQRQQQSSQAQQQAQQQGQQQGTSAQGGAVPRQEGTLNQQPPSTAAWGNLPDRVRDALLQGLSDRFSSRYKSLTEEYYKRLAEQPSRTEPQR